MLSSLGTMQILLIVSVISVWIFSLIDVLRNDFEGNNKLIWVFVVMFGSFIGAILYLFIGRKQRKVTHHNWKQTNEDIEIVEGREQ